MGKTSKNLASKELAAPSQAEQDLGEELFGSDGECEESTCSCSASGALALLGALGLRPGSWTMLAAGTALRLRWGWVELACCCLPSLCCAAAAPAAAASHF